MIKLTPFEHRLRNVLVRRAQAADPVDSRSACITYTDLGLAIDPQAVVRYPMTRPPFRGLGEALGHVSMYEAEHGRPLLSALVVEQESRRPVWALHRSVAIWGARSRTRKSSGVGSSMG